MCLTDTALAWYGKHSATLIHANAASSWTTAQFTRLHFQQTPVVHLLYVILRVFGRLLRKHTKLQTLLVHASQQLLNKNCKGLYG